MFFGFGDSNSMTTLTADARLTTNTTLPLKMSSFVRLPSIFWVEDE